MKLSEIISAETGIPISDVELILFTAPHRYKEYSIKKRNGRGYREIAQPSREVKVLQKWAITRLESLLPVHEAATAYRRGINIKHNALVHANNKFLLKLDFRAFFPSIKFDDVMSHLKTYEIELKEICDTSDDLDKLARLFLKYNKKSSNNYYMAIGAPSSPFISNSIMYKFDTQVAAVCKKYAIKYTRYADDMTFSTNIPNTLNVLEKIVYKIKRDIEYPKLKFNQKKTVHASMAGRRTVTGLVLTPEGHISIGRNKKRYVRAALHHAKVGKLDYEKLQKLKGYMAFVKVVEPKFYNSMIKRYGLDI